MQLKTFVMGFAYMACVCGNSSGQNGSFDQSFSNKAASYPITFRNYFSLLGKDCKGILVSPAKIRKKEAVGLGVFAGITAGLFFADPSVDRYVRKLEDRNHAIQPVGAFITHFGQNYAVYTIGAIYLFGYITDNKKLKTTTWLATQAIITSGVLTWAGKIVTGRERPSVAYNTSFFNKGGLWHGLFGYFDNFANTGSPPGAGYDAFPSGHTSLAFSIATVYAKMYNDHLVVPIIAYSMASLVGLSRITQHAHWVSDVFVGAVLGYVCGDQAVKTYKRSCFMQLHKHILSNVSYSLDYSGGKAFASVRMKL